MSLFYQLISKAEFSHFVDLLAALLSRWHRQEHLSSSRCKQLRERYLNFFILLNGEIKSVGYLDNEPTRNLFPLVVFFPIILSILSRYSAINNKICCFLSSSSCLILLAKWNNGKNNFKSEKGFTIPKSFPESDTKSFLKKLNRLCPSSPPIVT